MTIEANLSAKLSKLGLQLPPAPAPKGLYKSVVISGGLAYTSGHLPLDAAGNLAIGRLGDDYDAEAGAKAAQCAALNVVASLRAELGSLDRVKRVVKILGLVNSTPEFTQHPGRGQRRQRTVRRSVSAPRPASVPAAPSESPHCRWACRLKSKLFSR